MAERSDRSPLRVVFVCWGNICRSPMAERVAEREAADAGLTGVAFTSAATSSEELGAPMDRRAAATLDRHQYRSVDHVAHRIDRAELENADLVIAMEQIHLDKMLAVVPGATHLRLLTDFDPAATRGSGVPDPWYGDEAGFNDTLASIRAAMPGILAEVSRLATRS